MHTIPESLVVALGGNALHPESIRGTTEEQEDVAAQAAAALLPLVRGTRRLLFTHGNGPVVGKILMRMMLTREAVPPMRLDVCVAHSEGGIGYMLMQALQNALARAGIERQVACLLTQVEVDAADPAFGAPSKPVGPFFQEEEAQRLQAQGWSMMPDAGRGWRHSVPSPEPRSVVDVGAIRGMLQTGAIVIAAGGGGIPVMRDAAGNWRGVQAVVDKDLTSALLARALGIGELLLLTTVEKVALDFGKPGERPLDRVRASELRGHQRNGQFASGSMGPKVEAALRHVEGGGARAVISRPDLAVEALAGNTGTHVVPG